MQWEGGTLNYLSYLVGRCEWGGHGCRGGPHRSAGLHGGTWACWDCHYLPPPDWEPSTSNSALLRSAKVSLLHSVSWSCALKRFAVPDTDPHLTLRCPKSNPRA